MFTHINAVGIMLYLNAVVFCLCSSGFNPSHCCSALWTTTWSAEDLNFPPGFKFGAATAAYQVEGAWNVSGKGENIWDRFSHTNQKIIADGSTGDVACDSYHQWKKDVQIAKELGLHFYRKYFSVYKSYILYGDTEPFASGINSRFVQSDGKTKKFLRQTERDADRLVDVENGHVRQTDVMLTDLLKWSMDTGYIWFSISWSRILPSGFPNKINEDGKNYYNNLIDELLKNGIEPVVTMYHWDLPQRLQDLGGWTNPLIADWFADYARVLYSLYADRVTTWITINEPMIVCDGAYNSGILAPAVLDPDLGPYLCNKHILLAHAKAWRIYDQEFKPKYHGKVALCNHFIWLEPASAEDEELAELARQNGPGRYSHPIYSKEGGWPPTIEKLMEENSKKQGYPRSRLPAFTQEEIDLVRGTYDYYGFNHYTSRVVRKAREGEKIPPWPILGAPELGAALEARPEWKPTSAFWFTVNPEGIRRQLVWLKKQYGNVEVLITENGYASSGRDLDDDERVQYYKSYLKQVLLAIKEDEVNVTGYTAWTLIDNFEWSDGYRTKFGLYEVNFSHPERTRTPRKSARFYAQVIQKHSLDVPSHGEDL